MELFLVVATTRPRRANVEMARRNKAIGSFNHWKALFRHCFPQRYSFYFEEDVAWIDLVDSKYCAIFLKTLEYIEISKDIMIFPFGVPRF